VTIESKREFASIEEAIADIRAGRIIVVVDDEDRENEGDFLMAADKATPEAVNFMIVHGRGLMCMPMLGERLDGAVVARMYRHATHTQALMALNVPSILAVAPADHAFAEATDLDAIRAFRVEPQEVLVLHRGTWHWGPFPLGSEPIRLLNVQGLRYAEDNDSVDIAAVGEVLVAGGGVPTLGR